MKVSNAQRVAAMRARAAAMRARAAASMAKAKARVARRPPPGRKRRRDRRPVGLLLLALVLLVMAVACCCCGGEEPPPEVPEEGVEGPIAAAEPEPPPPAPLEGRVARSDRPDFRPPPNDPLPWLDPFRLQVAGRSPRLATCFEGVSRPGTLRWTAEVEPRSGKVSDHTLEPTLGSDPLTQIQRACVLAALSDPPYTLRVDDRATPSRVSVAIEF